MRHRSLVLAVELPVLALAIGARAGGDPPAPAFDPVSQDRSVSASAVADNGAQQDSDGESHAADGFEPFVEGASADASVPGVYASVGAWQESRIEADRILLRGGGGASAGGDGDDGEGDASGDSEATVVFEITAPTYVRLSASAEAYDGGFGDCALNGPDGFVVGAVGNGRFPVVEGGNRLLAPGTYTAAGDVGFAASGGPAFKDYGSGEFHLEVLATTPGDVDGDRDVDLDDLVGLLASFGPCPVEGPCWADVNVDADVDFEDLLVLLANWSG